MTTRAEREQVAQDLRSRGFSHRQIAQMMDVSRASVNNYLNDPGGVKHYAKKARDRRRYARCHPCIVCGATTEGVRCKSCHVAHQGDTLTILEATTVRRFEAMLQTDEGIDWCVEFAGRLGLKLTGRQSRNRSTFKVAA